MSPRTIIQRLSQAEPQIWHNPRYTSSQVDLSGSASPYSLTQILDAQNRLERFAPCLADLFPELEYSKILKNELPESVPAQQGLWDHGYSKEPWGDGIIESPLREFSSRELESMDLPPDLSILGKMDSHLPVSGSIKARGGVYEVLWYAEKLAFEKGLLNKNQHKEPENSPLDKRDYRVLLGPDARGVFAGYTIEVGSTGNLGLSIGIMGKALGFQVRVHMSRDAKQWKKDLLRSRGAEVREYTGDYGLAVAAGRAESAENPASHFIDDENSAHLFLGYSVAGLRLAEQLERKKWIVDQEHPLVVFLPCGVGGGPGGVTLGLKQVYGSNVVCYFVEPVQSPAVLLGLVSRKFGNCSVGDIGLTNETQADGLAVGSPSSLVCSLMDTMLTGCITVPDKWLFQDLQRMHGATGVHIEPSAASALSGLRFFLNNPQPAFLRNTAPRYLCWFTGGSMVPEEEFQTFLSYTE